MAFMMLMYLISYLLFCFTLVQSHETFDLYQPTADRHFLTAVLVEQAPWLLDVIHLDAALEQLEGSSHLSIFKKNNQPVGFICYEILNKTFMGIPISQYGYINGIAVAAQYQKMGYGKKLLYHVIDELKKDFFPCVRLQVRSDNLPALALYASAGFKRIEPSNNINEYEYYQLELQLK